jgi:hypothetical protein
LLRPSQSGCSDATCTPGNQAKAPKTFELVEEFMERVIAFEPTTLCLAIVDDQPWRYSSVPLRISKRLCRREFLANGDRTIMILRDPLLRLRRAQTGHNIFDRLRAFLDQPLPSPLTTVNRGACRLAKVPFVGIGRLRYAQVSCGLGRANLR